MKVMIDENLSPKIAKALQAFFIDSHEIIHIREKFGSNTKDIEWIETLRIEKNWIIISADRRITKNRVEVAAFKNSNIIGFFMSKGLYKESSIKQLQRLLALWDKIETQSNLVEGGAMFELSIRSNKLKML